jgi:site-specific DNA-methyltransferase (adenine-specific)/modification methylase
MRTEVIGDATLYLGDCLEVLPTLGRVDAVVTDPPYGIGYDKSAAEKSGTKFGSAFAAKRVYNSTGWDDAIAQTAIDTALEVSRWAVVFGGNYYSLPPSSCWLVWDKEINGQFADCELAWTNLDKPVRRIRHMWNGGIRKDQEPRTAHPTQKPLGVMKWCIEHLPTDVVTILDPFMGSGTTGVAALQLGRKFIGIELDPGYFDIACKRIEQAWKQPRLFEEPKRKPEPAPNLFDGAQP